MHTVGPDHTRDEVGVVGLTPTHRGRLATKSLFRARRAWNTDARS